MKPSTPIVYFASDFHLGIPDPETSLKREKLLVQWLDKIRTKATEIYLMGDLFDFWFEYTTVIPKGYTRLLGKIAEITDQGIPVYMFKGNHDLWAFDYLKHETGITLYRKPLIRRFGQKNFYLAHGDGLGPGDTGYKLLSKLFENKIAQFLFKWLHPDIGTRLGLFFSGKSRNAHIMREQKPHFKINMESEMLTVYCREILKTQPEIHYFIFGHRHYPINYPLNENSRLILLGDWISNFTYAVFDGNDIRLERFKPQKD